MNFIILPNQLFDLSYLDKKYTYYIWEHSHYFKKYKYNKKKIILHKASMTYYFSFLKKNNFVVHYISLYNKLPNKNYIIFDPIDKLDLPKKIKYIESPNFLLSKENYKEYRTKTDKFFFNSFYMWGKRQINIIPNIKSQDKDNRNKLKSDTNIPKLPNNNKDAKFIKIGINFTNQKFKNNYGNVHNFIYPVTHNTAKKFLIFFLKYKFKNFGKYQDAILSTNNYLYHSILSSSINIGLLNPNDIIKIIQKYKSTIPINSYEGYIRQLFWREYQRYCYIYINFNNLNYFNNQLKLTKKWYNGTTGILPVDNSIKNGFNSGYLHHIERLMIIGNYMNLSYIHPSEGFKWFMEFSCDSYEWVMCQNVYEMVFFVSGGKTMRRPYISSSNYILKMSNYKKDTWCDIWNQKYYKFIKKNKKKLYKFRYYFRNI